MKNIKQLEYFLGKYVTVLTTPINRDYRAENPQTYPEPLYHYFMGRLLEVDTDGIMVEQWAAGPKRLRTYFMMNQIVAIAEEETLDPNNPMDAAQIAALKEGNEDGERKAEEHVDKIKQMQEENPYLDLSQLAEIQKQGATILKD